jgi:DNA-binding protein HU-beta
MSNAERAEALVRERVPRLAERQLDAGFLEEYPDLLYVTILDDLGEPLIGGQAYVVSLAAREVVAVSASRPPRASIEQVHQTLHGRAESALAKSDAGRRRHPLAAYAGNRSTYGRTPGPTKKQFVSEVARRAQLSNRDARKAVDAFLETVTETLRRGDQVTFVGFGTFSTARRASRMGVNPRNPSQKVHIPATAVPKFSAASSLKAAVKSG